MGGSDNVRHSGEAMISPDSRSMPRERTLTTVPARYQPTGSSHSDFAWDCILIGEAQDWLPHERDVLFAIYDYRTFVQRARLQGRRRRCRQRGMYHAGHRG